MWGEDCSVFRVSQSISDYLHIERWASEHPPSLSILMMHTNKYSHSFHARTGSFNMQELQGAMIRCMFVGNCIGTYSRDKLSYLYKVYPPYSRRVCHPSLSLFSPVSWAPSSPALRASSWSWSPPAWAWGWGWPRLSGGAGTCPPCRHDASSAAPAEASHWARSAAPPTRESVMIDQY